MQLLIENGAEVDSKNCAGTFSHFFSIGQTHLAYCFARLDEVNNFFENKNLCLKMAQLLLDYGANINSVVNADEDLTLLMQFCGLQLKLTCLQAEANLEIIKFLLERGADAKRKSRKGKKAWDLAQNSPQRKEIREILSETKQKYFYSSGKNSPLISDGAGLLTYERELQQQPYDDIILQTKPDLKSSGCGWFSCFRS